MIHKSQAHKIHDRNTKVIRKGDRGWTSDNHHLGRQGEVYGLNPTSAMSLKISVLKRGEIPDDLPEPQTGGLEITRPEGGDMVCYRVATRDGELYWRRAWVNKGAAR